MEFSRISLRLFSHWTVLWLRTRSMPAYVAAEREHTTNKVEKMEKEYDSLKWINEHIMNNHQESVNKATVASSQMRKCNGSQFGKLCKKKQEMSGRFIGLEKKSTWRPLKKRKIYANSSTRVTRPLKEQSKPFS